MRTRCVCSWLAVAAVTGLTAGALVAQSSKPEEKKSTAPAATGAPKGAVDPEMQKMMEAFERAGKPGPEHRRLDAMVGTWSCDMKWWMQPGSEPTALVSKSTIKWIMDGRFLQEDVEGDGLAPGTVFHGRFVVGYDNLQKKYVSSWFDNMSTAIINQSGTWDAAKNALVMSGECMDPMTNKMKKGRFVLTLSGPGKMHCVGYTMGADGKEVKEMEINYTKQ